MQFVMRDHSDKSGWNTTNLHHMRRFINCPNHDILPGHLAFLSKSRKKSMNMHPRQETRHELLTIGGCKWRKRDRKGMTVFPEVLSCNRYTISNIRTTAIRQTVLRKWQKPGMPESQKDTWRKGRLPVWLRGDDIVHKCEQPIWVILNLDIHVELDMLVFGLNLGKCKTIKNESSVDPTKNGPSSTVQPSHWMLEYPASATWWSEHSAFLSLRTTRVPWLDLGSRVASECDGHRTRKPHDEGGKITCWVRRPI